MLKPRKHILPALLASVLGVLPAQVIANQGNAASDAAFFLDPERAKVRGEVDIRFFGFRIYRATLKTEFGRAFEWEQPFSLSLYYYYDFSSAKLTDATMSELTRVEGERADHDQIAEKLSICFPDVAEYQSIAVEPVSADLITIRYPSGAGCEMAHPDIRKRLMALWLGENTRDHAASLKLRGLSDGDTK